MLLQTFSSFAQSEDCKTVQQDHPSLFILAWSCSNAVVCQQVFSFCPHGIRCNNGNNTNSRIFHVLTMVTVSGCKSLLGFCLTIQMALNIIVPGENENRLLMLLSLDLCPFIHWISAMVKLRQKMILTPTRNCTDYFISLRFNQLLHVAIKLWSLRFFVVDLSFQLSISVSSQLNCFFFLIDSGLLRPATSMIYPRL